MNIVIKQFTIDLYDDVFSLWQQCEGVGLSDADSLDNIQKYIQRNPGTSYVALINESLVGVILGGHDGRRGYIHHLAVHPNYREKGIARKLVDVCFDSLAMEGIQKCHLFIFNDNKIGRAFWEATGWTCRLDLGLMSKNIEQWKNQISGE